MNISMPLSALASHSWRSALPEMTHSSASSFLWFVKGRRSRRDDLLAAIWSLLSAIYYGESIRPACFRHIIRRWSITVKWLLRKKKSLRHHHVLLADETHLLSRFMSLRWLVGALKITLCEFCGKKVETWLDWKTSKDIKFLPSKSVWRLVIKRSCLNLCKVPKSSSDWAIKKSSNLLLLKQTDIHSAAMGEKNFLAVSNAWLLFKESGDHWIGY